MPGPLILSKKHFFKKADFTRLFSCAHKRQGSLFVLRFAQQKCDHNSARFGIVVSKKYAQTSVQRNLIKRLIREYFRVNQHELYTVDLTLVAKKGIHLASKQELHQDLKQLFAFLKKTVNLNPAC